jgi:hypothetical protein
MDPAEEKVPVRPISIHMGACRGYEGYNKLSMNK